MHFELQQVSLRAPSGIQPVLQDLSFSIKEGSWVAVIGPSGSGKTSLLRLLNRLINPSSGRILLDGQDLRSHPIIPLRQKVGLVLQESKLLGMTVETALCYPKRLQGLSATAAQAQLSPWLERLKIPTDWLSRTEVELSVGQRQRVALARTLLMEPRVILLDEPTSAQDLGYAEYFLAQLHDLTQTQGLTVIMVNHQLELLAPFTNHVLCLNQGRLVSEQQAPNIDWPDLRQQIVSANQKLNDEWPIE